MDAKSGQQGANETCTVLVWVSISALYQGKRLQTSAS